MSIIQLRKWTCPLLFCWLYQQSKLLHGALFYESEIIFQCLFQISLISFIENYQGVNVRTYFEGKIFGQKSHIYTSSAQDNADPDAAVDFEVYFHSVTFFFFFKILLSQARFTSSPIASLSHPLIQVWILYKDIIVQNQDRALNKAFWKAYDCNNFICNNFICHEVLK